MAANSRSKATTWVTGEQVTHTQFEMVESNAAGAVARASTLSGTRNMPLCLRGYYGAHHVWATAAATYIPTTSANVAYTYTWDLVGLPPRHSLISASIKFQPASGHVAEPGILPSMSLLKIAQTGAVTSLGTSSVSWTTTGAYETATTLQVLVATASRTIYPSCAYAVRFGMEGATSATGDLKILRLAAVVTIDSASGGTDMSIWV